MAVVLASAAALVAADGGDGEWNELSTLIGTVMSDAHQWQCSEAFAAADSGDGGDRASCRL